ncbi:MAG: HI0074 family nucleotidyltransferase substrate-binding subunit [bacterium]|nr:HI0074 family nucleotidyltransferase substrate-binding subunit [bacterium]
MTKFQSIYEDFTSALVRFEEVLKEEKNEFIRDSAIKRFEIVFDLSWKTVKAFLEEQHNATCVSPKTCYREAFRVGLVDYDEAWMKLCDDRNYTVHTYKESLAEKIYTGLPKHLSVFQKLNAALKEQGLLDNI